MKREKGSGTILLLGILVPTLLIASSVMFGLLQFSDERQYSQRVLDESLLSAARYLPDELKAREILSDRLTRVFGASNIAITYETSGRDTMAVKLSVRNKSAFLNYLINRNENTFHIVGSQVSVRPQDVIIFFDSSQYVAPLTYNSNPHQPWILTVRRNQNTGRMSDSNRNNFGFFEGITQVSESSANQMYNRGGWSINGFGSSDPIRRERAMRTFISNIAPHWQAARAFRDQSIINELPSDLANELDTAFNQLYYSQKCFNPTFNAIKQTAISLWDHFASIPTNRVAVVSGPVSGSVSPHFEHNNVFKLTGTGRSTPFVNGGNPFQRGIAEMENSKKVSGTLSDPRVRDQDCWRAMKVATNDWLTTGDGSSFVSDSSGKSVYIVPPAPSYLVPNSNPPGVVPPPNPRFNGKELDRASIDRLSVRDAIWGRAVSTRRLEFPKLISYLINTIPDAPSSGLKRLRGSLQNQVERKAFLVLGDFPWFNHNGTMISLGKQENDPIHDEPPAYFTNSTTADFKRYLGNELSRLNRTLEQQNLKLKLYISIPRHEGSYPQRTRCAGGKVCPRYSDHFQIFESFLSQNRDSWSALDVIPIAASDPGTIALDLLNTLLSSERTYMLNYI